MRTLHTRFRRVGIAALGALVAACSTDRLLVANDPDLVNPGDVESYLGADAIRVGAMGRLTTAVLNSDAAGEGYLLASGLLADEWRSGNTFNQTNEIDQRSIPLDNANVEQTYRNITRTRNQAIQALELLRKYPATPGTADALLQDSKVAQMWFVRGLMEMYLAEGWCNGLILSQTEGIDILYGGPISTDSAAKVALASFDSALASAKTDTLGARIANASRIGRARALLWLNRLPEARTAAAAVPTAFNFNVTHSLTTADNGIWSMNNSQFRYTIADTVDQNTGAAITNNLPFVTARDARVPYTAPTRKAFDGVTPLFVQQVWADRSSSVALLSGVDARLIEAEAALRAGDATAWLAGLNALRTGPVSVGGIATPISNLPALTDPVTPAARIDRHFREAAFWQFGRGWRLGNMRRLVRQYSRDQANVFPTGVYPKAGTGNYGSDVNFPVPLQERSNPNYAGCTNRSA